MPEVPITFVVRELLGTEVYKWKPDFSSEDMIPLTKGSDLQPGDSIVVRGMGGFYKMIVEPGGASACSESGAVWAPLRFSQDQRACWVAVGIINRSALTQLQIRSTE